MNSFSRSGNSDSGRPGAISDSICAADRRLVLAEAGVDQHGGIALRQQIAVRHRIAARAGRIGADPAVERIRVLQGVELAFGERRDPAAPCRPFRELPGALAASDTDMMAGPYRASPAKGTGFMRVPALARDAYTTVGGSAVLIARTPGGESSRRPMLQAQRLAAARRLRHFRHRVVDGEAVRLLDRGKLLEGLGELRRHGLRRVDEVGVVAGTNRSTCST